MEVNSGVPIGDFLYKQMLVRMNDILLEMRDELNATGMIVKSPFDISDDDINDFLGDDS